MILYKYMILFKTTTTDVYEWINPSDKIEHFLYALERTSYVSGREIQYDFSYDPNLGHQKRPAMLSDPTSTIETIFVSHIVSFWEQSEVKTPLPSQSSEPTE